MKYRITDDCVACGICIDSCKYEAISQPDTYYEINPEKCVGCGDCYLGCPVGAIISIPNFAIFIGDKIAKKFYVGDKQVRAVYAGTAKVWPSVVRVDRGYDYGEWTYDDPVRRRTVTPWEQNIYCDDSVGERRYGTPYTQEETATNTVDWDGATYWNGSCGTDYYYVDYQKVSTRYTYSDGTVRYSDYYNGEIRSRRIDGQCGWVRDWRDTSDWYRTGGTCNAVGVNGAYDCDGTYSVNYWNEGKDQSYCYPDMSGSTQTRTIWRVGPVAERKQVDGQCGYTSTEPALSIEVLDVIQSFDAREDRGSTVLIYFEVSTNGNTTYVNYESGRSGFLPYDYPCVNTLFKVYLGYKDLQGTFHKTEDITSRVKASIYVVDRDNAQVGEYEWQGTYIVGVEKDDQQTQSSMLCDVTLTDPQTNLQTELEIDFYGF